MNRRELLKKTCGIGLCSCAGLAMLESCDSDEDAKDTDTSVGQLRRLAPHVHR